MIGSLIHDLFYQVLHPWHWLTYGQNSQALSSLATLIAAAAAIFAGYFAIRTYRATLQQLDLATKQYWDAHKSYLESVRPHLQTKIKQPLKREITVPHYQPCIVKNVGMGRAINIIGSSGIAIASFSLAADAECEVVVELLNSDVFGEGSRNFLLYYSSVDGRRFRSETTISGYSLILNEEESDISAGIEPPTFEELQRSKRLPAQT